MSKTLPASVDSASWMQHIYEVHSKRTPEACEAARAKTEAARQHESSYRKCKAAKGHSLRTRTITTEALRQMSTTQSPEDYMAAQSRWQTAQTASKAMQTRSMRAADDALMQRESFSAPMAAVALRNADEEEEEEMHTVGHLVGATDITSMVAVGAEGLAAPGGAISGAAAPARRGSRDSGSVEALLRQLRQEPTDDSECSAKFMLYEGYASEVEQIRETLFKFYDESQPTVPAAIQRDMQKQIKSVDSQEAMGIPDDAREWFVFHMMRQAERNNVKMVSILDGFEKKLAFLASNEQVECPVCLEEFQESGPHAPETLACCHKVCSQCWANWSSVMHGRPFCPLCRNEEFLGRVARHVAGHNSDSD